MADLYRILGVNRDADATTIKKAYKKLVRQYHPDRNKAPNAVEKFQEIKHAYEILSSPEDRKMYDLYGDMMFRDGFHSESSDSSWNESGAGSFDSFFRGFTGESSAKYQEQQYTWEPRKKQAQSYSSQEFGFGNRRRAQSDFEPPERGTDIRVELKIGLLEAIQGCKKKIKLRRPSRWKNEEKTSLRHEIVVVDIPPNTNSGSELKVQGKGNYGKGGGADGNLLVLVLVQPSDHLFREGADLILIFPITLKEALEGAQVEVPTLGKSIKIRIPKGVKMGQRLRIKGRGAPKSNGNGDLYLILYPVLPTSDHVELTNIAQELEKFYPQEGLRNHLRME